MRNNPLRIFIIFIVLTCFMTSCDFSMDKIHSIEIENHHTRAKYGEELTLTVKDEKKQVVDPAQLFWQSSDYSVAVIGANGTIRCVSSGPVVITASLKDDMTVTASTEIFIEYDAEEQASPIFTRNGIYVNAEFGKIGDLLMDFNFSIIDAVTSASLPVDMILNLFSSDKYQFSMMYYQGNYQNAVICPLTDWSNMTCPINTNLLTPNYIHEKMVNELGIEGSQTGNTFEIYQDQILEFIEGNLPRDLTYHFSKMSSDKQYRVVLKGDFDHLINVAYYSNGVLTGLKLTVEDLLGMDFDSIATNYSYQKFYDEIVNISNLRICVEYREMTK